MKELSSPPPQASPQIDLNTPLSLRTAFRFPLQNALARKEVLIGALLLLFPVIGWLLNMGHRIAMTHKMQHGQPAWPSWNNYPLLLRHGVITFLGMAEYHAPAVLCELVAWHFGAPWLRTFSVALWILATVAVPGYMSHYCDTLDAREVLNPARALKRVFQGGTAYWHAWLIALLALLLSLVGLAAFGIGFLITSVWFWQVAGFSFATVFTQRFVLHSAANTQTARS